MNSVARHYVANGANPDGNPGFTIGVMLPQLARAAGTELDPTAVSGSLLQGLLCGQEVDAAYYGSHIFRLMRIRVTAHLGTVNAIRHAEAGLGLLLDGVLLARQPQPVTDNYRHTLGWLADNYEKAAQAGTDPEVLSIYLEDFADSGIPVYLMHPQGIVNQFRQRFDVAHDRLPRAVQDAQAAVEDLTESLMADVVSHLQTGKL